MSITTGVVSQIAERHNTKSFHQRHDSGELDVFEASRYFSYTNEVANGMTQTQKTRRSGRVSLDSPMITTSTTNPSQILPTQMTAKNQKKFKQPSSPGGRLASFLNSLFSSQTSSKKKKSKSSSIVDDNVHETPVIWSRKRRRSINHFPTTTTTTTNSSDNTYAIHSYSRTSGLRTPPPAHANKPTKNNVDSLKAFRNSLDHRLVTSGVITTLSNKSDISKKNSMCGNAWLGHDKLKSSTSSGAEKDEKYCKTTSNFGNQILEVAEYRNFMDDDDDGGASDSSSDLFELPNYDLDCCSFSSSGLPVYESTRMDAIKTSAPIATRVM